MKEETPIIKKKTVYLPADLDDKLRLVAKKHRRSFNGELIWAIQHYLECEEKEKNDELVKRQ